MKLTFLGHASWLIQTATTSVVSDLITENAFRRGSFTICPTRALDVAAMPKLDAVIISHQHRDHFDLETLLRLDRRTRVLCPKDPLILHALARLGYANVEIFSDWSRHAVGDLQLAFTPSELKVPENGILVTDGRALFWNQVDTQVSPDTIGRIREKGPVDLVAHAYNPMLERAVLEGQSLEFPYAAYSTLLRLAKLLAPSALVPSSNGYRVAGANAWFNAFKFPVSRERFVRDVVQVLPQTQTFIPNPGDVVSLDGTSMVCERQRAGFVSTVADDARALTQFDPAGQKPALCDDNPTGIPETELRALVAYLLETRVPAGCKAGLGRLHPLRLFGAHVEVRVVYPGGQVERWGISLADAAARVRREPDEERADYVLTVTASALHDLATGRTRSDVVVLSGQVRFSSRAYRIEGGHLVTMDWYAPAKLHGSVPVFDQIWQLFWYERDFDLRLLDAEIDRLLGGQDDRPFWQRPAPTLRKPAPVMTSNDEVAA